MSMVMMRVAGVPPASGIGVGAEESVADVFEGVVHPLPVMPEIGLFDQPPVRGPLTRLIRGFAKGPSTAWSLAPRAPVSRRVPVQDPSRQLVELDVAAVVVELVFGSGAVGVDPVDHLGGEDAEFGDGVDVGEPDQQLFPFVDVNRVEAAPVDLRQRPFDDRHLLRARPARPAAPPPDAAATVGGVGRACWSAHPPPPRPAPAGTLHRGTVGAHSSTPGSSTAGSTPPAGSAFRRRRSRHGRSAGSGSGSARGFASHR